MAQQNLASYVNLLLVLNKINALKITRDVLTLVPWMIIVSNVVSVQFYRTGSVLVVLIVQILSRYVQNAHLDFL